MSGKKVMTEILRTDELPVELYQSILSSPDHLFRADGRIYLAAEQKIIILPDDPDGNDLLYSLIRQRSVNHAPGQTEDVFLRIMNDPCFIPEQAVLRKFRIDPDACRYVIVFQAFSSLEKDLYTSFSAIAPIEKEDTVLQTGFDCVVLIRNPDFPDQDEIIDFTDAVIGTMESEGITGIKAGIGRPADGIHMLRNSYLDAQSALSLGIRYHRSDTLYLFDNLMLERILDSIPEEKKKEIREFFSEHNSAYPIHDEMLETVRIFFQNDLNLTAASRQLFIHRNTLNYRLDKIKKEFHLDLRRFTDAVVFKIISDISELH